MTSLLKEITEELKVDFEDCIERIEEIDNYRVRVHFCAGSDIMSAYKAVSLESEISVIIKTVDNCRYITITDRKYFIEGL